MRITVSKGKMDKDIAKAFKFGFEEGKAEALKEFKRLIDEVIENGSWKSLLELKVKLNEAGK